MARQSRALPRGGSTPGIDIDVGIRCFGEYSYRICNPALFYTNVCGNVAEAYTRDKLTAS